MRILAAVLAALVVTPSALAVPNAASYASGDHAGGCIALFGASVQTGRSSWVASFYPGVAPLTPAGGCEESASHIEPPITCVDVRTTPAGDKVLSLGGRTGNTGHVFRVVDASADSAGYAAVTVAAAADCGSAAVEIQPFTNGVAVLASV